MPFFEYRAVDAEGNPVCGAARGESADAVRRELLAAGLRASAIRRRDDPGAGGVLRPGVTREDLAALHRHTASLLAAGLPLPRALRAVARESRKREFQVFVEALAGDVEKGRTLSDALREHPRVAPPFLADLVKAGEAAGSLPAVLLQMAETGEAEARLRRSVKTALAYPLTVAVFALAVVLLNGTGLAARLFFPEAAAASRDIQEMFPSPRGFVSFMFDVLVSPVFWGVLLAAFIVGGLVLVPFLSLRGSRTGVPVFGKLVEQVLVSRFCRVLALLVGREVPLPVALRLAGAASDSHRLASQAASASDAVAGGRSLAEAIDAVRVLPATARWGIAGAAARGALVAELEALARHADDGAADAARRFGILLETSLVLVVGALVLCGGTSSLVGMMRNITMFIQSLQG